ncbi:hypothetical protein P691DRAFT_788225 [Macrolepiota fuliginosa MF-IS2]|uniref:Uncharacterized protein n=1 Tax=Macrolepiota fuliginosa MF-IS2 TaxID=1400762 RepID=A0A9P6BWU2_9AGAR|nr:hypothetical protein P691DRAFT_788225 [Macrolepiota fuliginosa MF-IS2]
MSSLTNATFTQMKYVEVGTMVAMALFGISTVQVYIYFRGCDRDPRWMKFFIAGIWCDLSSHRGSYDDNNGHWMLRLLEFVHTFLSGHTIYSSTVPTTNSSRAAIDIRRVNELSGTIGATISSCAQGFFAFRLYIISQSIWLPVVCWTLSAVKLVTFYMVVIRDISGGQRNQVWGTMLVLPGVVSWAGDLLGAAGLLWCIWVRHKEQT